MHFGLLLDYLKEYPLDFGLNRNDGHKLCYNQCMEAWYEREGAERQ